MGGPLSPGDVVDDKYKVIGLLGEGGMGVVYEGENTRIKRRVAIKILHTGASQNAEVVRRFEQEAQAAARVGSSHIVDVLDLGDLPDGHRYMVMEFLEGESLSARLRQRARLPPAEVAPIAIQLLDGLAKVHEAGIIHRDLKPGNIFLAKTEQGDFVKILDFGICKFIATAGDRGPGADVRTGVGKMMGTPSYMAPEQADSTLEIDHRADLYSVGVMLYRAVSGRLPHQAENVVELLAKLLSEPVPPLECVVTDVDRGFALIVNRATAMKPGDRYQSAKEFRADLVRWMRKARQLDRLLAEFLEVPAEEEDDGEPIAPVAPPRSALKSDPEPRQPPDEMTTLPLDRKADAEPKQEPETEAEKTDGRWGSATPSEGTDAPTTAAVPRRRWTALVVGLAALLLGIIALWTRSGTEPARVAAEPRVPDVAVEQLEAPALHVAPAEPAPPPASGTATAAPRRPPHGKKKK
jgi:serine/threonine-protein kinase